MNKFRLLAIALVLGVSSLFANTVNPDVSKDEIRKQIVELVDSSTNKISEQITVKVIFSFSSEGEIIVKKIDSENRDVIAFIRKNLNHKILENPGRVNKDYTMPIVIK